MGTKRRGSDRMVKSKEILTVKRCGILLITACLVYLVLNIVIWKMNLVVAIIGAICTTIAFGLFLYFIRDIEKRKIKERISKEMKADIIELGEDTDPVVCKQLDKCTVIETCVGNDGSIHLKVLKSDKND